MEAEPSDAELLAWIAKHVTRSLIRVSLHDSIRQLKDTFALELETDREAMLLKEVVDRRQACDLRRAAGDGLPVTRCAAVELFTYRPSIMADFQPVFQVAKIELLQEVLKLWLSDEEHWVNAFTDTMWDGAHEVCGRFAPGCLLKLSKYSVMQQGDDLAIAINAAEVVGAPRPLIGEPRSLDGAERLPRGAVRPARAVPEQTSPVPNKTCCDDSPDAAPAKLPKPVNKIDSNGPEERAPEGPQPQVAEPRKRHLTRTVHRGQALNLTTGAGGDRAWKDSSAPNAARQRTGRTFLEKWEHGFHGWRLHPDAEHRMGVEIVRAARLDRPHLCVTGCAQDGPLYYAFPSREMCVVDEFAIQISAALPPLARSSHGYRNSLFAYICLCGPNWDDSSARENSLNGLSLSISQDGQLELHWMYEPEQPKEGFRRRRRVLSSGRPGLWYTVRVYYYQHDDLHANGLVKCVVRVLSQDERYVSRQSFYCRRPPQLASLQICKLHDGKALIGGIKVAYTS